jgi:2-methylcitrate dehydratase PrpD
MAAQYSVPFCVAVAMYDDALDPNAFLVRGLADPRVRSLAAAIEMAPFADDAARRSAWASEVVVRLKNGRELARTADDFIGTPSSPLSLEDVRAKYLRCAGAYPQAQALLAQLERIDALNDVRALALGSRSMCNRSLP